MVPMHVKFNALVFFLISEITIKIQILNGYNTIQIRTILSLTIQNLKKVLRGHVQKNTTHLKNGGCKSVY